MIELVKITAAANRIMTEPDSYAALCEYEMHVKPATVLELVGLIRLQEAALTAEQARYESLAQAFPSARESVHVTASELSCVINWLEGGRDPKDAAKELRLYCERAWTGAQQGGNSPEIPDSSAQQGGGGLSIPDGYSACQKSDGTVIVVKDGGDLPQDERAKLLAEIEHWKANHSDVVKRLKIATERPDLPVDRIPTIKELERLQAAQRAASVPAQPRIVSVEQMFGGGTRTVKSYKLATEPDIGRDAALEEAAQLMDREILNAAHNNDSRAEGCYSRASNLIRKLATQVAPSIAGRDAALEELRERLDLGMKNAVFLAHDDIDKLNPSTLAERAVEIFADYLSVPATQAAPEVAIAQPVAVPSNVKRYYFDPYGMRERPDGDWVQYSSVAAPSAPEVASVPDADMGDTIIPNPVGVHWWSPAQDEKSVPDAGDEPFMYGIADADGKPHFDEHCVGPAESDLHLVVNGLNDSPDAGYAIVPLYTRSQPTLAAAREVHITPEKIMEYDKHCTREQAERLARQINQH